MTKKLYSAKVEIFVLADSEDEAKWIACSKGETDSNEWDVDQITSSGDVPSNWISAIPFSDDPTDDRTCDQILDGQPVRPKTPQVAYVPTLADLIGAFSSDDTNEANDTPRPAFVTEEHLEWMDGLRRSSVTNMMTCDPFILDRFDDLDAEQAAELASYWRLSFGARHG